ncbi:MAG: hypothetical protein QS98_C0004G0064 [archaeon GW2011_AR3]|nr:MAG: hypothetical protein QS98_C0004G0064 [archaeon GW2011_AR3]MBS3109617.1 DUF2304 domain-containing protein [Candidatus Woesearchaeota archaeon]
MVLGIQILGSIFALFMLYVTFLHQKRKEYTVREYVFWTFFWIVFGLVSLFPNWLDPITTVLRLTRTLDLFIILGFMFIIAVVIYVYDVVRKTQKKVEEVVRKVAIEDASKKSK